MYVEFHGKAEGAPIDGADGDAASDVGFAGVDFHPSADDPHGALETGREAHCEELLGIGPATLTSQFRRWANVEIEDAI
jgi:hypothetical protein